MSSSEAKTFVTYGQSQREDAPIPRPGVELVPGQFALVVTDPQNDFLSPDGVTWGVVGESVQENGTVEHIRQLFEATHSADIPTFVSPRVKTNVPWWMWPPRSMSTSSGQTGGSTPTPIRAIPSGG